MLFFYILVGFLMIIVLLLAAALYYFSRNATYVSDKEKEFVNFVIDIFIQYGDDLGIQSKEQHVQLTKELEKIKTKHFKTKKRE